MPNDMYQHLRSVAIDLLGPDTDPDSEYVRALVELTVAATGTGLDDPDDLREDLERDLRESREPQVPLWLVTAYTTGLTFEFEWSRYEASGRSNFLESIRHGQPGTRVVLKRINVPTSIATADPVEITDWFESHEDDFEAYDELLAAVID